MIDEHKLFFGLPIPINKNTFIYQPKLKDILSKNLSLELLIEPFISLDKQNFEEESTNDKLKNFDMFFIQMMIAYMNELTEKKKDINIYEWINSEESNLLVIKRLIKVFKFLFQTDDVELCISDDIIGELENNYIMINKSYKIDRNTYDDIKKVICEVFDTQIKIEKKKVLSEEEDEMEKLFAKKKKEYEEAYGKKEKKEKNRDKITIFTLVNYIIHNKITQYNYETVQELTIYQIKNTFKYYQSQELYDIDIRYRTSGNFKIDKKDSEHWFFDK